MKTLLEAAGYEAPEKSPAQKLIETVDGRNEVDILKAEMSELKNQLNVMRELINGNSAELSRLYKIMRE